MPNWEAVIRIVQYLKGTIDFRLTLGGAFPSISLQAYADADWAGDTDSRKSRTGYIVQLNNSVVMYFKPQPP